MAEKFSFFDPVETVPDIFDREYNAQEFTDYFASLVTTGIMKGAGNELKVATSGSNMVTEIDTGIAFVEGHYYANDSKIAHTHDTETLGKNRIDRIVIRLDLNTESRFVKSFIKKGIASASPVAPTLQRDDLVYEISLAQVKVIGGQTFINVADVVDERENASVCGWAGSKIIPNFDDSSIGQPGGIATLDGSGKVPQSQLNIQPPVDATTGQKGIVQLNDTLTTSSTSQAATTNAVKQVNDKLTATITKIGKDANAFGANTVAVGNNSEAYFDGSVALGAHARAQGTNAVVIGKGTTATGNNMGKIGPDHLSSLSDRITFWQINGDFYVANGTKNFVMQHPHPDKKDTHLLRHAAIESPTVGDNLYRYTVEATEDMQIVEVELPDYFMYLNKDVDVHVSPFNHFGVAYGMTEGNVLKVTCQTTGTYKVIIIGTRNDDAVSGWEEIGTVQELGLTWQGETAVIEDAEIVTEKEIVEEETI